jgi:DNA-binding response OmpR family regulator
MQTKRRVLVVEDDADVRQLLRELLADDYELAEAGDGRSALRALFEARPDLVVLDVLLPELDGWSTLQRIREVSDLPVLMLTAVGTPVAKVRGLRGGADDYVTKPFDPPELLARIEALMRRAATEHYEPREVYHDASLRLDHRQRAVRLHGRELDLTPTEYRLLAALVARSDEAVSHDELRRLVWGTTSGVTREEVRLYVSYLRSKLGAEGHELIETVRAFGYRYRPS